MIAAINVSDATNAAGIGVLACLISLVCLVRLLLRWSAEECDRMVREALEDDADVFGEPTRAQVEWDMHVAEAVALAETPIYGQLRREQFVVDALAEIEELTKGGAT